MTIDQKALVQDFLDRVKKKLPVWMREDDKECDDLLKQMEEHIWDKAEALANEDEIKFSHVQEAIAHMGSPEKIVKEFKKRGTPKYFISEEWWYWYLKVLSIVCIVIVGISFVAALFSIGRVPGNPMHIGQMFAFGENSR